MNISTKEIDRKVDETEGKARILTGWQLRPVSYTHLTLPTKA